MSSSVAVAVPDPQTVGPLLVEDQAALPAIDLDPDPVLPAGGDLADREGADDAGRGAEDEAGDVLGVHGVPFVHHARRYRSRRCAGSSPAAWARRSRRRR